MPAAAPSLFRYLMADQAKAAAPVWRVAGLSQDRTKKTAAPPVIVTPLLAPSLLSPNLAKAREGDGSDGGKTVDVCAGSDNDDGLALGYGKSSDGDSECSSSDGDGGTSNNANNGGVMIVVGGGRLCIDGKRSRT